MKHSKVKRLHENALLLAQREKDRREKFYREMTPAQKNFLTELADYEKIRR